MDVVEAELSANIDFVLTANVESKAEPGVEAKVQGQSLALA